MVSPGIARIHGQLVGGASIVATPVKLALYKWMWSKWNRGAPLYAQRPGVNAGRDAPLCPTPAYALPRLLPQVGGSIGHVLCSCARAPTGVQPHTTTTFGPVRHRRHHL